MADYYNEFDPLARQRAYDRRIDIAHSVSGVDGDLLRQMQDSDVDSLLKRATEQSAAENALKRGMDKGKVRGEELFGKPMIEESQVERSGDMRDIIAARKRELGGFAPEEMNAQREAKLGLINSGNSAQSRELASAQRRSGVRGGTAAAQNARLQTASRRSVDQSDRDLFLANIAEKRSALDRFEKTISGAESVETERLGKRKFGQAATELGYGSLASGQNAAIEQKLIGQESAQAARQSANSSSGGTFFICTELRRQGLMNPFESARMVGFMLKMLRKRASFSGWYITSGLVLVERMRAGMDIHDWRVVKVETVGRVLSLLDQGDFENAANVYISMSVRYANQFSVPAPGVFDRRHFYSPSKLRAVGGWIKVFSNRHAWDWLFRYYVWRNLRGVSAARG